MKISYFILFVFIIYLIQFSVLPILAIHLNLFLPFIVIYALLQRNVTEHIGRIFFASLIFDAFSGLPFPLITVSVLVLMMTIKILYKMIFTNSTLFKILAVFPISILLYWSYIFLGAHIFEFFSDKFHLSSQFFFNEAMFKSLVPSVVAGLALYFPISALSKRKDLFDV